MLSLSVPFIIVYDLNPDLIYFISFVYRKTDWPSETVTFCVFLSIMLNDELARSCNTNIQAVK